MQLLLDINSKDLVSGLSNSTSNFTILFKTLISDISSVELISCTIPNTIYNINSTNNVFAWTHTNNYSIMIPTGSYTVYNLLTYLQTQMNNTDSNSYALSYSSTTFTVTITATEAFTLNFATKNSCYQELGFLNQNTSLAASVTGPTAISLNYPLSIYIVINEFGVENITSSNIKFTFKIPVLVNSGNIVEYDTNALYSQKIDFNGIKTFSQLTIQLIDEYGNNINLLGSNFALLLKLEKNYCI